MYRVRVPGFKRVFLGGSGLLLSDLWSLRIAGMIGVSEHRIQREIMAEGKKKVYRIVLTGGE